MFRIGDLSWFNSSNDQMVSKTNLSPFLFWTNFKTCPSCVPAYRIVTYWSLPTRTVSTTIRVTMRPIVWNEISIGGDDKTLPFIKTCERRKLSAVSEKVPLDSHYETAIFHRIESKHWNVRDNRILTFFETPSGTWSRGNSRQKLVESASLKFPSSIESISLREYSHIIDVVISPLNKENN